MTGDADRNEALEEDAVTAVRREMAELARQLETTSPEELEVLAELLCDAGREDYKELLWEVTIRKRLRALGGRELHAFLVLVGIAILVATVIRVGFFVARPLLGFGLLGGVILLLGLRGWYLAKEVRERMLMIRANAELEDEDRTARSDRDRTAGSDRTRNHPRNRRRRS
jgi:membrane-bound ClpP family serine protease